MSSYTKLTKHPITGNWEQATWIDDFYGPHYYAVRFPDGMTFDPDKMKLETMPDIPPGVSQWRETGIKFGYDEYFNITWPEDK